MNNVVATILRRHSVREGFLATPVAAEILEDILLCGLAAPSSKNAQPWRFHVVTDRSLLDELASAAETSEGADSYVPCDPSTGKPRSEWASTVIESAAVLRSVPVAIFIENTGPFSRGRDAIVAATPDSLAASIVGYTFEAMGLGAACENMWIAAVAHGLSAVLMGDIVIAERRIQRLLAFAGDLAGVLALGYVVTPRPTNVRPRPQLPSEYVRWIRHDHGTAPEPAMDRDK